MGAVRSMGLFYEEQQHKETFLISSFHPHFILLFLITVQFNKTIEIENDEREKIAFGRKPNERRRLVMISFPNVMDQ